MFTAKEKDRRDDHNKNTRTDVVYSVKGCQKLFGGRQGDACQAFGHGLAARVPPFRWAGLGLALPYPCNHRKHRANVFGQLLSYTVCAHSLLHTY